MYYMKKCIQEQISRKLNAIEYLSFYGESKGLVSKYFFAIKKTKNLEKYALKAIKAILDKGYCPVKTLAKENVDEIVGTLLEDPSKYTKSIFAFRPHEAINEPVKVESSQGFLIFLDKAIEYMILYKKVEAANDLINTCKIF